MRGLFSQKMGGLLGGYLALFVGGLTQKRPVGALNLIVYDFVNLEASLGFQTWLRPPEFPI